MQDREPKILIVNGQSIYDQNATGITLKSIFSCYNKDNVMEVYYSQGDLPIEIIKNSISSVKLKAESVPLNYAIRKFLGKKRINTFNQSINYIDIRSQNAKKNKKVILKAFILGLINYSPLIIRDKEILNKIDDFSPDIIYTLGADIIPLKLAIFFSKRYKRIPILLHYMDNWVETKYSNFFILKPFHKKLHKILNKIHKCNPRALVISDKMAKEYNLNFKSVTHYSLMNSIDIHNVKFHLESQNNRKDIIIFAYLGGLHLNRDKQLLEIQKAINEFNISYKQKKAKLRIYTSKNDRKKFEYEFDTSSVEFCDYVDHDKVYIEYQKADVLVHIESFDEELVKYTKYSLSTKISEYMFAKKPILLYAPYESAVYQYILENECGFCTDNYEELKKLIKILIFESKKRSFLGYNGFKNAMQRHTIEAAHNTLVKVCYELLEESGGNENE